ncbi:DUF2938 family protein [Costertonia aggregata]|uniref:DUF2938 family protein n=1 Tax=Costertonia aggregata TaxID=343403 RepID=A0A7H9AMR3_9FLAO|nr:DUF2938 family protein [Costertonia aggregata]QLG44742.1 DUF2938 family protein [Costertonia aggregata]
MRIFFRAVLVGIGATFLTDLWAFLLRLFDVKSNGLQIIGSWLSTNVLNVPDSATGVLANGWIIGWTAHYIVGITFAIIFLAIVKSQWFQKPTWSKALIYGIVTLVFPLFMVWPTLGFGVAFSKTPIQGTLIIKAIGLHLVYGLGLYLTAFLINKFNSHKSSKKRMSARN